MIIRNTSCNLIDIQSTYCMYILLLKYYRNKIFRFKRKVYLINSISVYCFGIYYVHTNMCNVYRTIILDSRFIYYS